MARGLGTTSEAGRALHLAEAVERLGAQHPHIATVRRKWSSPAAEVMRRGIGDSVSARLQLRGVSRTISEALAHEVAEGRRAGESALVVARRLRRVASGALVESVPGYVKDLRDAVRGAPSGSARRAAIDSFRGRVLQRGSVAGTPFSIRSATTRLLSDLDSADARDIDAAVARWVDERATIRARTIARTEANRAFSESFLRAARANPSVEGVRWNLSTSHPKADICDLYAEASPDGIGEGVYKVGTEPSSPAHANCLCFFTSVIEKPDGSSGLEDTPERDFDDALEHMSSQRREEILGPGRLREFQAGGRRRDALVGERGQLRGLAEAKRISGRRRGRG